MSSSTQDVIQLLEKAEDYPQWVVHTEGILKQKNCIFAIQDNIAAITYQTVKRKYLEMGFTEANLKDEQIFTKVGADVEKQSLLMLKAEGIIQMRVAPQHHTLISTRTAGDMWRILKIKFQDIAPMSITDTLYNMNSKKMTNYENVTQYCAEYEKALNSIKGMIDEDSELNAKGAEQVLQGYLLRNVIEDYLPLIAQLRRDWITGRSNLTTACRSITAYSISRPERKALHINASRTGVAGNNGKAPPGTCTFPECVRRGRTSHLLEKCFQKYPNLRRQTYPLESMKTRGTRTSDSKTETVPTSTVSTDLPTVSS